MKKYISLVLMLLSYSAFGQNPESVTPNQSTWLSEGPKITFPVAEIPGTSPDELVANAEIYLKAGIEDLKNPASDLFLSQNVASPYARYMTFAQTFLGYDIYGTSIKIGVDKKNKIVSVLSKTGSVDNWPTNTTISDPDTIQLKSAIGSCDRFDYKKVWFYSPDAGIPAFQVNCIKWDGSRNEELVLDSHYNIIYRHSLIENYKYPDSLVTMYVFYPDPLTSAHSGFVPPYSVNALSINDTVADNAALDSQMEPKQIRVSILNNDSFILENEFVTEKDLASPRIPESTYSKIPVFRFHRDTSAFRDLMIYYHINNYRNHLKDLGYDSLGKAQIIVDPSGEAEDNSVFYPPTNSTQGIIYFGIGGIPDAEDADIPTHEYTHFLSYSACNNCATNGIQRSSLDEGTADYFAASNSKAIDTFGWRKIFNWDGNAPGWSGRSCAVNDVYPGALDTFQNEIHLCGQLWSSALMQIWDSIGRTKTDRIMLETLYSMAGGISMSDAAKLFLKSDSLMYNGADSHTITYYFVKRGFLPESASITTPQHPQVWYKITTNYFSTSNEVLLDFSLLQSGTLTLYDMTGRLIASKEISNSDHVQFNGPPVARGIYILGVNTQGLQKSFKLLK